MSRYVDLDGPTWDGTPITSKIQEVETRIGYLQGITIGWLWGDNVPHMDLEEHDKQIRAIQTKKIFDELFELMEGPAENQCLLITYQALKDMYREYMEDRNDRREI